MSTAPDPNSVAHELRTVVGRLIRRLRAEATLPLRVMTVLSRLDRDGPQTTSALAERERMRPQSMAETVKGLEAEGLARRSPDPGDGRRLLVTLTPAGRAAVASERTRREDWLAQAIVDRFSTSEQKTIAKAVALLSRLTDAD